MSNAVDKLRANGAPLPKGTDRSDPDDVDNKQRECFGPYSGAAGSQYQRSDHPNPWVAGDMTSYGGSPTSGSHSLLHPGGVGRSVADHSQYIPTIPPSSSPRNKFNPQTLFSSSENLAWRASNERSEVPGNPPAIVISKNNQHTHVSDVGGALDFPNMPSLSIPNAEKSDEEECHTAGLDMTLARRTIRDNPEEEIYDPGFDMTRGRRTVRDFKDNSPEAPNDHPVYSSQSAGNASPSQVRDWFIEPRAKEAEQTNITDKHPVSEHSEFQPYNLCSTNWKYSGQPNDYPGCLSPPNPVFSDQSNHGVFMGMSPNGLTSVPGPSPTGQDGLLFSNPQSPHSPALVETPQRRVANKKVKRSAQLPYGFGADVHSLKMGEMTSSFHHSDKRGDIHHRISPRLRTQSALSTQQPVGPECSQVQSGEKPSNPRHMSKRPKREYFYPTNNLDAYYPPKKHKLPEIPTGPVYSLKVGYVATGRSHIDRNVAHIALVNQNTQVIQNLYIKQTKPVVSYLTPLTSLDEQCLKELGIDREKAIAVIQEALRPDAILVGHRPGPDIRALGLIKGRHYRKIVDLNKVWQVWNPSFQTYTRFTMDHLTKTVLNIEEPSDAVSAVNNAMNCVQLWNNYLWCRQPSREKNLQMLRRHIIESPRIPSYAAQVKTHEGVCLGAKRACVCNIKEEWDPISPVTKGIYCTTPKTISE
jgi:hypothetical protein